MPKRRKTATQNVEAVVGRRLCKKTRANYDSNIKLFTDSNVTLSDKTLSGSGYIATSKKSASDLPEHARLSKEITD